MGKDSASGYGSHTHTQGSQVRKTPQDKQEPSAQKQEDLTGRRWISDTAGRCQRDSPPTLFNTAIYLEWNKLCPFDCFAIYYKCHDTDKSTLWQWINSQFNRLMCTVTDPGALGRTFPKCFGSISPFRLVKRQRQCLERTKMIGCAICQSPYITALMLGCYDRAILYCSWSFYELSQRLDANRDSFCASLCVIDSAQPELTDVWWASWAQLTGWLMFDGCG